MSVLTVGARRDSAPASTKPAARTARAGKRAGRSGGGLVERIFMPLMLAVGVCLMAYPAVAAWINEQGAISVVSSYEEKVDNLTEEEHAAMKAAAVRYNESLAGDPVHDPFIEGSGYALPDDYEDVVNVDGQGLMGTVSIPSAGLRLPIYHGVDADTLEKGAGHMPQTSLPIGGPNTHAVLTGHTALPGKRLFDDVGRMKEGDLFVVDVLGEKHAYQVERIQIVEPDDVSGVRIEDGRDLVTLLTCTPYGINSHRLLVTGVACDLPEEVDETPIPWLAFFWILVGVAVCATGILVAGNVRHKARLELKGVR